MTSWSGSSGLGPVDAQRFSGMPPKFARQPGCPALADWGRVFHEPLVPEPRELVDARTIAEHMRKPGESEPSQHMGEAETIAIVVNRGLSTVFLTDDHDAARRAAAEPLITVASTTKIIAFAEVKGRLEHTDARRLSRRTC